MLKISSLCVTLVEEIRSPVKLTAVGVISCRGDLDVWLELTAVVCDLLSRRLACVVEIDSSWCDLLSRRLGCVSPVEEIF